MAELVLMPQMGISEDSAVVTEWHAAKGDAVKSGDKLFSIETGKAVFDIEAAIEGVILEIYVNEGDEVPVKLPVCAIGKPGETAPDVAVKAKDIPAQTTPAVSGGVAAKPVETQSASVASGVSPRARALARKAGVDQTLAAPTGPEGRVIERDIRALIQSGGGAVAGKKNAAAAETRPAPAYQDKPLSNMRKIIARNMMASLANSAQLTHTASFDATNIQDYRKVLKTDPELAGVTLTDMILYAVSRTLHAFPALNAWLMGDSMRYFREVSLACAVDTERGLMVPVIFGASGKSLLEISNELKALAQACRDGTIASGQLEGGSFTVSNVGVYGIESFTPILNPPQTGILGVNAIIQRVREAGGKIEVYPCMTLSLTYDHRALDGAPASKFLQALCRNLEGFTTFLAR